MELGEAQAVRAVTEDLIPVVGFTVFNGADLWVRGADILGDPVFVPLYCLSDVVAIDT